MSLHCTHFTCIPIGTNTSYMTGVTGRSSTVVCHPSALRLPCMQDRFWYVKLYNKTLNETRKLIPPEQQHNILSLNTFRTNHTYTSKYMYNAKHPSLKKYNDIVLISLCAWIKCRLSIIYVRNKKHCLQCAVIVIFVYTCVWTWTCEGRKCSSKWQVVCVLCPLEWYYYIVLVVYR